MSEQLPACGLCGKEPFLDQGFVFHGDGKCPLAYGDGFIPAQWRTLMTPPSDVAALTAERDALRKDLCEIASGCGMGVPDQAEAKRRIIAIASERDRLRARVRELEGAVEGLRRTEQRLRREIIKAPTGQEGGK